MTDEEKIRHGAEAQALLNNSFLAAFLDEIEADAFDKVVGAEEEQELRCATYMARTVRDFRSRLKAKVRTGKQAADRTAR